MNVIANRNFAMMIAVCVPLALSVLDKPADKSTGRASGTQNQVIGDSKHILKRVAYNHTNLTVDLGVGLWAWPLPMDYDGDGDYDLVVSCSDKPYNGIYFFENPGGRDAHFPVFKPGVRIAPGMRDICVSRVGNAHRVMTPGLQWTGFKKGELIASKPLSLPPSSYPRSKKTRANQWRYCDYDGDGDQDLVVGIGDWHEYGWDDAFDAKGRWTRGPLHGYVYLLKNSGTDQVPRYEKPEKIIAGGKSVDVYGMPSPNFADFDGDGDLDLLCGEFIDRFTYFENQGTRRKPRYAKGRFLLHQGKPLRMDLQMIVPVAIDWDKDGDVDLIVGDEDGRVAIIEHTGKVSGGMPVMRPPRYFRQQATDVKFGALVTPCSVDWDGDGDEDLICGNTAGYIGLIENLSGGKNPRWAEPRYLKAGGKTIRIQAGSNGSIQGPCEAKWGYTTLTVADWNHDQLPDVIVNSIWGKVVWYRNIGTRNRPRLSTAQPIVVQWPGKTPKPSWFWWQPTGKQLVTQWRTTPVAVDWDADGLTDLIMLDHQGYLALFKRRKTDNGLRLEPGRRIFVDAKGNPLRPSAKTAGGSGRRKLVVVDWDGDGRLDILINSVNADWWQNKGTRDGKVVLENRGPLYKKKLAGHTSSPTVVDWNGDGVPELLIGAEDGYLYHAPRKKK